MSIWPMRYWMPKLKSITIVWFAHCIHAVPIWFRFYSNLCNLSLQSNYICLIFLHERISNLLDSIKKITLERDVLSICVAFKMKKKISRFYLKFIHKIVHLLLFFLINGIYVLYFYAHWFQYNTICYIN